MSVQFVITCFVYFSIFLFKKILRTTKKFNSLSDLMLMILSMNFHPWRFYENEDIAIRYPFYAIILFLPLELSESNHLYKLSATLRRQFNEFYIENSNFTYRETASILCMQYMQHHFQEYELLVQLMLYWLACGIKLSKCKSIYY